MYNLEYNLEFSGLKYLLDTLHNDKERVPFEGKLELIELLEDALELKGKKSAEKTINILRSKITNKLKKEFKDALRDQYSLPDLAQVVLAKLLDEVPNEMKQIMNKLKQLEVENNYFKAQYNKVEQLNRVLKKNNETKNKNNKLKAGITEDIINRLRTQIWQLQQEKKILEAQNKIIEQSEKKTTRIATAIVVGLVVYITLEHTTKLDMWLIVVIATVSAFLAGGLIMKPSSQVNGTQEPQEIANESSIA